MAEKKPVSAQALVNQAAKQIPALLDFVREDDREISYGQLWAIALGMAYLILSGEDPHKNGWMDWFTIGIGLAAHTLEESKI